MNNTHVYALAGVLATIGVVVTLIRVFVLDFPLLPEGRIETWNIEARIEFEGINKPVQVELLLPRDGAGFSVISENFVSEEFGLRMRTPGNNRQAVFSLQNVSGRKVLFYRATIRRSRTGYNVTPQEKPKIPASSLEGAALAAASSIATIVDRKSSNNSAFQAFLWGDLLNAKQGSPEELLLGRRPSRAQLAKTAVTIMGIAGLGARTVHGLALAPNRRDAQFNHWTEVYEDGRWLPYDPGTGLNEAPTDHLTWWRGNDKHVQLTGGENLKVDFTLNRAFVASFDASFAQKNILSKSLIELSVFGLPIQTQDVFRILFVLPIAYLLLVVLRNVIGLKTFGTFLPVLIALGFRETGLVWGLFLFAVVFAGGLSVRAYMEQLKLLMVPRIATVATVVIIIMAVLSVVTDQLGFERGLSLSLFPIVILTMAIERMSTVIEESGNKEAIKQAVGSTVAVVLSFFIMNINFVEHFFFVFPESLLVVLAGIVLLGRYSGYRLTELPRFRVLAKPDP